MPLSLKSLDIAIICDGNELETYNVKQDGPNSIRAHVASEAGKQFKIMYSNKTFDIDVSVELYIDGELISDGYLRAGLTGDIKGIQNSSFSVLPFKFQELQLVDPDVENAPVAPEIGTIELRVFRCQGEYRSAARKQGGTTSTLETHLSISQSMRHSQPNLTHQMRRLHPSRSFIVPENC